MCAAAAPARSMGGGACAVRRGDVARRAASRGISSGEGDRGGHLAPVGADGRWVTGRGLWVAHADCSGPQGRPDGADVDAEPGTDSGHGLALGVDVRLE